MGMSNVSEQDLVRICGSLRQQAMADAVRITAHAHQEMVEDDISLEEVREVLLDANTNLQSRQN